MQGELQICECGCYVFDSDVKCISCGREGVYGKARKPKKEKMIKEDQPVTEFNINDIEDVKVIVKAKGKHYSLVPKRDLCTDEQAKQVRILMCNILFEYHFVVSTPLEDLKIEKNECS